MCEDELKEYTEHTTLTDNDFENLVKTRQKNAAKIDELKKANGVISDSLKALMVIANARKVRCGKFAVRMITTTRGRLSKTKLLDQGVTPDVIESSTTYTEITSLRVDKNNGKKN